MNLDDYEVQVETHSAGGGMGQRGWSQYTDFASIDEADAFVRAQKYDCFTSYTICLTRKPSTTPFKLQPFCYPHEYPLTSQHVWVQTIEGRTIEKYKSDSVGEVLRLLAQDGIDWRTLQGADAVSQILASEQATVSGAGL